MKLPINIISYYKITKRRKYMNNEILRNIDTRIRTIENAIDVIKDRLTIIHILQNNVATMQKELNELKHKRKGGI